VTTEPLDRVAALLAGHGVHARRPRRLLALLCAGWQPFDELVRVPVVPRRTVEEVLSAASGDTQRDDGRQDVSRPDRARWRIVPERVAAYRERLGLDLGLDQPEPARAGDEVPSGSAADPAAHPELLARLTEDVAAVPPPLAALDHVPATPESVLRRALWLDARYELAGARLLCLGDHDLTSLAVCAVNPDVAVTVVDLDERVLEFVEGRAAQRGWNLRCLHADLRFGLPPAAAGWADLVFTDPPYTQEGMGLFLARGVECLRDPAAGRLLVAYGYSGRNPTLGLKVQQEIVRMGIAFEAILPDFHRYRGAQAVGSSSDLYVCQPTGRARRATPPRTGIYTHGPQSVEAGDAPATAVRELLRLAGEGAERRDPGWAEPAPRPGGPLAFDLTADPGPWLARTLLARNAGRVAALVGNNHPDLADERGQRSLTELVGAKYRLRFHRSTPDHGHAVVVATEVPEERLDAGERLARAVLSRAHGKIGNTWREALVAASGGGLTKNAARELVAAHAPDPADLALRLVDLPRHRVAALLAAVRRTPTPHPADRPSANPRSAG